MEPLSAGWSTTSATSHTLANVVNMLLEASRYRVRPPFLWPVITELASRVLGNATNGVVLLLPLA